MCFVSNADKYISIGDRMQQRKVCFKHRLVWDQVLFFMPLQIICYQWPWAAE